MKKKLTIPFLTAVLRRIPIKIKYFTDTDTALLEFSEKPIAETEELNENIYIHLDEKGSLVSMTIEHAKLQANINELAFQQIDKDAA